MTARAVPSAVQALCGALHGMHIASCAVDMRDLVLTCNQTLLAMIPAQGAQPRVGAPWRPVLDSLRGSTVLPLQNTSIGLPGIGTLHLWQASHASGAAGDLVSGVRAVLRECLALLDLAPEGQPILEQEKAVGEGHRSLLPGRRLQDLVAEHSSDVVALVRRGVMTYASPAVRHMLGWDPAQLEGLALVDYIHPDDQAAVRQQLQAICSARVEVQARMRCANGEFRWVEAAVAPLREAPDGSPELVLNIRDIAARKARELTLAETMHALEQLAHTDSLTGIANRRSFDEHVDAEWRRCRREGKPLAVLLLDIDRFKQINDRDGHQAGDRVLQRVARCLQDRTLRAGDQCARYGGDEFAMLLPNTTIDQAMQLAERVRADVAHSRGLADEVAPPVTVSIGVAASMASAGSPAALVSCADEALYQAKMRGRDSVLAWKEGNGSRAGPAHHPGTLPTSGRGGNPE